MWQNGNWVSYERRLSVTSKIAKENCHFERDERMLLPKKLIVWSSRLHRVPKWRWTHTNTPTNKDAEKHFSCYVSIPTEHTNKHFTSCSLRPVGNFEMDAEFYLFVTFSRYIVLKFDCLLSSTAEVPSPVVSLLFPRSSPALAPWSPTRGRAQFFLFPQLWTMCTELGFRHMVFFRIAETKGVADGGVTRVISCHSVKFRCWLQELENSQDYPERLSPASDSSFTFRSSTHMLY